KIVAERVVILERVVSKKVDVKKKVSGRMFKRIVFEMNRVRKWKDGVGKNSAREVSCLERGYQG
ncbi:14128_t:CDS:1, partial [Ambispora leptoticha]